MNFNKFHIFRFNFFALFVVFFYLLQSCSLSNKFDKQLSKKDETKENSVKTKCPEEGNCFINFFPNKGIEIKTVNNNISYNIIDDSKKTVIQFQYSKNQDQTLVDGGYRETVFFEVNNTDSKLDLNNFDLQKVKMIFAKYCHCRGKSGVFLVNIGNLKFEHVNQQFSFTLNFNMANNPSLVNQIIVKDNLLN